MPLLRRQMLGFALAIIGFLGTIIVCTLPMWKVTTFRGSNTAIEQVIWEGLWMNCVSTGMRQRQCKSYDSPLLLPQHLQAGRGLVVIAIIFAAFGVILGIFGGKFTNFVKDACSQAKVTIAAGIFFICSGVFILIPVCLSAHTIIKDLNNPIFIGAQRGKLGAALYVGWGTAGLLFLGGALLCSSCPGDSPEYPVKYSRARSTATS